MHKFLTMSHRKVYSQGNIPFSWEDSPGISKVIHPLNKGLHALNLSPPPPPPSPTPFPPDSDRVSAQDHTKMIPLPPCQTIQPPRRSISAKGLGWWQDDPFLAAYKECTKNERNGKLLSEKNKKNKARKSRLLIFSCKNSCDVKDDSFIKLCNLPPIPRGDRGRGI